MKLCTIDSKYIEYLKRYEPRIWENRENGRLRAYIGVVLNVGDKKYYAPLTHAKEKHMDMQNRLEVIRLEYKSELKAVINLNNMIPVNNSLINIINISLERNKIYRDLLNAEIKDISRKQHIILKNAIIVYNKATKYRDEPKNEKLVSMCYDFKFLEEKCCEYCKQNKLG